MDNPPFPRHIHMIGACGTAMGGVAEALAARGVRVTGSDENVYGSMAAALRARGIPLSDGFDARNLDPAPDLVVIGRTYGRGNAEVEEVLDRRLPYRSMPAFLREYFLQSKRNLVVAGTKGKTTTTAMAAWILDCAGKNPSHVIGGTAANFPVPTRFTDSDITVIEGDDYTSLWCDDSPKFCHYLPEAAIITNIYPDHPEIHMSDAVTLRQFECLVNQLPRGGELIAGDMERSPLLAKLAGMAPCRVRSVAFGDGAEQIRGFAHGPGGIGFTWHGVDFRIALPGRMNARNAVAAAMAVERFGVDAATSAAALREFRGVRGRMEPLARGGIDLYRDLGYLPECMEDVFDALRARHPGRRLVFLWQPFIIDGLPQSQDRLRAILARCDLLLACDPYRALTFKATSREYVAAIAEDLIGQGVPVEMVGPFDDAVANVPAHLRQGDVVISVAHCRQWSVLDELADRLDNPEPCAS